MGEEQSRPAASLSGFVLGLLATTMAVHEPLRPWGGALMRRMLIASGVLLVLATLPCPVLAEEPPLAPTGDVAARVYGEDITEKQLDEELAKPSIPHSGLETTRLLALQMIIARKLLAQAARDQGLDKSPEFATPGRSTAETETLLAHALQNKLLEGVPAPTPDEVQTYIVANPDVFALRRIFDVDSIRFKPPAHANIVEELKPLNTMSQIVALLKRKKLSFVRKNDILDSVGNDPKQIAQLRTLPPKAVFVIPVKDGSLSANLIIRTRIVPLLGPDAERYATFLILAQRRRDAVQASFGAIMANANARRVVVFNPKYQPPTPSPRPVLLPASPPPSKP